MPDRAARGAWLPGIWYAEGRPPLWLLPLAALYGFFVGLRRFAYRAGVLAVRDPGVPVVVVGNLTAGGTGKTPLVLWLAARLRESGSRPGIVLRGHGGSARGPRLVAAGDAAALVGDEAAMLAQAGLCPVAIGARRAEAAALLAAAGCDVVVSDDGLQHLAMHRVLQIVVVDGARGFGNSALLPAGPLREPASALGRADLVVMHGADLRGVAQGIRTLEMQLVPGLPRELATGREVPLSTLQGAPVHAVAGIGNPARFFASLRALGIHPLEHPFADHHAFAPADLGFDDGLAIVMTGKDAVKCRAFAAANMYCLPVEARLSAADAARLLQRVSDAVGRKGGARA